MTYPSEEEIREVKAMTVEILAARLNKDPQAAQMVMPPGTPPEIMANIVFTMATIAASAVRTLTGWDKEQQMVVIRQLAAVANTGQGM